MSEQVTKEHFDKAFDELRTGLRNVSTAILSKDDVRSIVQEETKDLRDGLQNVSKSLLSTGDVRSIVQEEIQPLRNDFSDLQTSVDGYLKRTETWYGEQVVLRSRVSRIEGLLVAKKLATEDEVTGMA